jgi:hypothetical protein
MHIYSLATSIYSTQTYYFPLTETRFLREKADLKAGVGKVHDKFVKYQRLFAGNKSINNETCIEVYNLFIHTQCMTTTV